MSRTSNSTKNAITGVAGYALTVIIQFITRTVFIKSLGSQYLGITGLFTNIISMLSLTELGMGTAIMYKLYKPISENDKHRLTLIMKFYKNVYRIIGIAVLAIGLILMPFLKFMIKDDVGFINIYFVFFMYLLQSVLSYMFFAYKSALIQANQKEYIVTLITNVFLILSNIVQVICLTKFKSFNLYLIIAVLSTVLMNLVISIACNKLYPFVNIKTNETIAADEKRSIFKDCYALFIYKINGIVLNSTDNLILSKCIGLTIVGIYSNYLMIFNTLSAIATKIFTSVTASLGNLHAQGNTSHELKIFNVLNLCAFIIASIFGVGITVVTNELIEVWLGSEYLLNNATVMLIGFKLYIDIQKKVLYTYRNAMGLFQQAKYRPVAGMIINLVVSVVLVKYYGITGVILGTVIADLLTYMWYDPYIIFKFAFKRSVKTYYIKRGIYFILYTITVMLAFRLNGMIKTSGIAGIIIHGSVCVVLSCVICFLSQRKKEECEYICNILKGLLKKRVKI